jgi:hypothetical protein
MGRWPLGSTNCWLPPPPNWNIPHKPIRNSRPTRSRRCTRVHCTRWPSWRVGPSTGGKRKARAEKSISVVVVCRGVLPFAQRKRLWEKYRTKCRKQRPSSNQSEIVTGSQVCMKNSPMYQAGAIGFTVAAGVPKVGQLQNAAWTLSDTCTFKIINVQTNGTLSSDKSRDASVPGPSGLCKSILAWNLLE